MTTSLIGKKVWIETPTKYWLGRVVEESMTHVWLDDATWIVKTGQYGPVMSGTDPINQCEPVPSGMIVRVWLPTATVIDWPHALVRCRMNQGVQV